MLSASPSPSLYTDLYQLTMAYGHWQKGKADQQAVFHLYFRKHPFKGSFTLAAGLQQAIDWLLQFGFGQGEIAYLRSLKAADGSQLFEEKFLAYLSDLQFSGDVWAVPEGTPVYPQTPILRVEAPLIVAQLVETALLSIINFQTLIATKAARITMAAQGDPVLEFGLRRAHGLEGGLWASRAAFIGGCTATSNVMAGYRFEIPVRGTHAHSWIMSFQDEPTAFQAYASSLPAGVTLLVDTYDTLQGVEHAIETGRWLRTQGYDLQGIRLDSGDLVELSRASRQKLDAAGFHETLIVASNDLDEYRISSLKDQGAAINIWGVGTRLVTAYDQPALGGVYKLAALQEENHHWRYTIKLSEQAIKASQPGRQRLFRAYQDEKPCLDILVDESEPALPSEGVTLSGNRVALNDLTLQPLHMQVIRAGSPCYQTPALSEIQQYQFQRMKTWEWKQFDEQRTYPVALSPLLDRVKTSLMRQKSFTTEGN